MKKYVFWDFNGTVLDDCELALNILNKMEKNHNRKLSSFEDYRNVFTFPVKKYYEEIFDFNECSFEELSKEFIANYYSDFSLFKLNHSFLKTIQKLNEMGTQSILLSATKEDLLHAQLDYLQIGQYFKDVIGIKDIYATSKIEFGRAYVERNAINTDEAIMLGDTIHDGEVGIALGMDVILYKNGHQNPQRLTNFTLIDDLYEIINILKK
jgi:phosphoglycolate phosphatase